MKHIAVIYNYKKTLIATVFLDMCMFHTTVFLTCVCFTQPTVSKVEPASSFAAPPLPSCWAKLRSKKLLGDGWEKIIIISNIISGGYNLGLLVTKRTGLGASWMFRFYLPFLNRLSPSVSLPIQSIGDKCKSSIIKEYS